MATPAEKAAQLRAFNDSLLDNDPEMVDAEGATKERLEVNRPPQQAIDEESIIMRRRRPVLAIQNGAAVLEFKDEADVPLWKVATRERCHRSGRGHPRRRAYRADGQSRLLVGRDGMAHQSTVSCHQPPRRRRIRPRRGRRVASCSRDRTAR